MIRTPDQRLRVFISSTIQELADERLAAKRAIDDLRLIPVLFEIGARPYPPRDLYQAYLAQSDIFIGIYWNSYGWIAPDMDISGLEDEYRLSNSKPRLMYIKKSQERQERLAKLIAEMGQAGISYKSFTDAGELKELIANDLALFMSEQFYREPGATTHRQEPMYHLIPSPDNAIIGRETEIEEITSLLFKDNTHLVTIIGMGGTGKTRLAIEIAQQAMSHYHHGVAFINLSAIREPELLPSAIAQQLGLSDSTRQSVSETLLSFLSDKHLLLVLDNFEQLTEGATFLSEIIRRSKEVSLLVTSRKPLYLRAEHAYPLLPLALPEASSITDPKQVMQVSSVSLFIERAKSVNPRIKLDTENLNAICILCEKLGGLPLAIELAAMRTRYLTPIALLKGMQKTLDILSSGTRDMPDRQQSFRATIDWSYHLLSEEERTLFRLGSAFRYGWSLPAIAAISGMTVDICSRITEQLIDAGLIRFHTDAHGVMRYDMLKPIEEFAEELLASDPAKAPAELRYLDYFLNLTIHLDRLRLTSEEYRTLLGYVESEHANFRHAFRLALRLGKKEDARRILYPLSIHWFREALQNEGLRWMEDAGLMPSSDWNALPHEEIRHHAMLLLIAGSFRFFLSDYKGSIRDLHAAREMFEYIGQKDGVARCYAYLGLVAHTTGDQQSMLFVNEAIRLGKESNDIHSVLISSAFLAEAYGVAQRLDEAHETITIAEQLLSTNTFYTAYALGLGDAGAMVYLEKGHVHFALKDFDTAKSAYKESLRRFEFARTRSTKGYAFASLAAIAILEGKPDDARDYGLQALNDARESGDIIIGLFTIRTLAAYLIWNGKVEQGMRFLQEVETQLRQINYSQWCIDMHFIRHINEKLAAYQMSYPVGDGKPEMGFDGMIGEITKAVL